jgi:hypothetical protein
VDRNVTVAAAVVAVGVLGIAVAAATLTTAVPTADSGVSGGNNGSGGGLFSEREPPETEPRTLPPIVGQVTFGLFALGAVAASVYAVVNWRDALQIVVVMAVIVAAVVALAWLLSELLGTGGFGGDMGLFGGGESGSLIDDSGGQGSLSVPPVVLVIVGGALVAAVVTLFGATSDLTADEDDEETQSTPSAAAAGVGRAAGRAAERIEADADVDNEVYDAWKEMTTYLEVDQPASSTPGEFAAAAVDAGMTREDVDELTRLFEEVRYGGADPADREQRAVATLRRIEAAYGG